MSERLKPEFWNNLQQPGLNISSNLSSKPLKTSSKDAMPRRGASDALLCRRTRRRTHASNIVSAGMLNWSAHTALPANEPAAHQFSPGWLRLPSGGTGTPTPQHDSQSRQKCFRPRNPKRCRWAILTFATETCDTMFDGGSELSATRHADRLGICLAAASLRDF